MLLLLLACAEAPAPVAAPISTPPLRVQPPPTEHVLGPDAEKRSNAGRREWHKRMHRAPRGVDWEAVERTNGLRQLERRKALAPPAAAAARWVERGSTNQAGRTHVTRHDDDGAHLYIGSSNGGLWRGTLDGEDFEPLGDATYGGVHHLEVLGDTLVTATDGGIVLRSTDAGATWSEVDVGATWWIRRLVKTADDTLFLLTAGDEGVRLLRSEDDGATFQAVATCDSAYGDVFVPRDGGEGVWLLDGEDLRRSDDSGDTWVVVGPAPATSGTWDLAGSEAGAPTFYAIGDGGMFYRSDDAGVSWTYTGAASDYWGGSIAASVVDAAVVVYGGVEVHPSFDGGVTFGTVNGWGEYYGSPADRLHADVPGLDVMPDGAGGETWYVNTDGGTYRSFDGLRSVENLSLYGLRIGQYYDVLTSSADPTHVAVGAQDQGYQITNDVPQDDDRWEMNQILSGDYGHLTSGDGTHEFVYSVYPGFVLIQMGETAPTLGYADFPGGESYVPWLPPIVADPERNTNFFFPAGHLYIYRGRDGSWTPELWSEQDFRVASDEYVSRLSFSPVDPDRAVAITSYGRAWYSDDKGVTWERSPSMVADDNWYYGQAIAPSRTSADIVTIGGSGYGVPAVYRSEDGGRTYFPWSEGLPDTLVYTLVEASDNSGTVYAGTQTAAYKRGPDDDAWVDITDGQAPLTIYWDAEALADSHTIRFATYGRGIWDYEADPDGAACFPGEDADGDGSPCELDCDDDNAAVHPGATEACDGVDADCDPATPDAGEVDADADGSLACLDCDDRDPIRTPGAEELCGDGVDEDCDGEDPDCPAVVVKEECGCGTTGSPAPLAVGLLLLLARRRR